MLFTIVFDENGLTLNTTDIETAFHACDMPQLVQAVINAETGKVLWGSLGRPVRPDKTKTKVGGVTRASVTHGVKQYDDAIIIPMAKEWLVVTHSDIPTCRFLTMFERCAIKRFERSVSSMWGNEPFYDEVRLYHNGIVIRAAVLGHEIVL